MNILVAADFVRRDMDDFQFGFRLQGDLERVAKAIKLALVKSDGCKILINASLCGSLVSFIVVSSRRRLFAWHRGFRFDRQHRTGRVAHHLLGDVTDHQALDAGAAMSRQDYQIGQEVLRAV